MRPIEAIERLLSGIDAVEKAGHQVWLDVADMFSCHEVDAAALILSAIFDQATSDAFVAAHAEADDSADPQARHATCPTCNRTGTLELDERCTTCTGRGWVCC